MTRTVPAAAAVPARSRAGAAATGHRPEIHGLRGVAIALVIVFHLWGEGRISGGVDVFLIISAYLLAGSMARRGDQFDFADYLVRRFRRLVPQAAVVILVTLLAGYLLLPPVRWPTLVDQAFSSLFYWQNWALIQASTDYTADSHALASPLQHYWSLSVQGQIFVIWPLVLLLAIGLAKLLRTRVSYLLAVLFALITVASFWYAHVAIAEDPAAAYFDTFARAWEFALASLVAVLPAPTLRKPLQILLGWMGLAGVLATGVVVGRENFPGMAALYPVLSTIAVIWAGSVLRPAYAAWWLSTRPVKFLADRAYGLYLWHWPIYVYYLDTAGKTELDALDGVIVIGLSVLFADISTRLIERRFNQRAQRRWRGVLVTAAVLLVSVGTIGGAVRWVQVDNARLQAENRPGAQAITPGAPYTPEATRARIAPGDAVIGRDWHDPLPHCAPNPDNPPPASGCTEVAAQGHPDLTIAMVGDSHTEQWITVLAEIARAENYRVILLTHGGCRYTVEIPELIAPACAAHNREVTRFLLQERPDILVTVDTWSNPGWNEEEPLIGMAEAMQPLIDVGIRPIGIRDNPRWSFDMPECVQRYGADALRCTANVSEKLLDQKPVNDDARYPSIDLTEYICPGRLCTGVIGGVYVYMDDNHLSKTYARTLIDEFAGQWHTALAQ
ncbi:acyltransferase family protein [Granulicoccus phenolivorans]|uniref:acyltransferase family protein n=1 Tax=Granulicoccus phenolivorans TaxID=266854 RepID=UPI0003FF8A06|nr:acyltransferase family protein [Granulicoccus phenolivorans]